MSAGVVAENQAIRTYLNGLLEAESASFGPSADVEAQGWRRFRLGRMWMAVPAARVMSVLHPPHELRPVVDAPPEVLGSVEWGRHRRVVIDPSVIVLETGTFDVPLQFWHGVLVLMDSGWWTLACDDEADPWDRPPEDARLRIASVSRPWLAGVHTASATVFLNPDGLVQGLLHRKASPWPGRSNTQPAGMTS